MNTTKQLSPLRSHILESMWSHQCDLRFSRTELIFFSAAVLSLIVFRGFLSLTSDAKFKSTLQLTPAKAWPPNGINYRNKIKLWCVSCFIYSAFPSGRVVLIHSQVLRQLTELGKINPQFTENTYCKPGSWYNVMGIFTSVSGMTWVPQIQWRNTDILKAEFSEMSLHV